MALNEVDFLYRLKAIDPEELERKRNIEKQNVKDTISYFLSRRESELQEWMENDETPVLIKIVSRMLLETIRTGCHKKFSTVMDQLIGKPSQRIDVNNMNYDDELKKIPAHVIREKLTNLVKESKH